MTFMHITITIVNHHDQHWIFRKTTKWDTWKQGEREETQTHLLFLFY